MNEKKKRVMYIDLLRIYASFMVIVNHAMGTFFEEWAPCGTWFAVISVFFMTKPMVIIFIMIAGYNLLNRVDDYSKNGKRIVKILQSLVGISIFHYLAERMGMEGFGFKDFFQRLLRGEIDFSLWFMYLYLGILMMLPFLQKFVKGMGKKDLQIFFAISIGYFSVYPVITAFFPIFTIADTMELSLFGFWIGVLLMGYYFANYAKYTRKGAILTALTLISCIILNVIFAYQAYYQDTLYDYMYNDKRTLCFVLIQGICTFYLAGFIDFKGKAREIIFEIGKDTFGIYLVHMFFVRRLEWLYIKVTSVSHILIGMLAYDVAVFVCSLVTARLFRKVMSQIRSKK